MENNETCETIAGVIAGLLLLVVIDVLLRFNPYYDCFCSLLLLIHIIPNSCRVRLAAKPEHMSTAYFVVHNTFVMYHQFTDDNLFQVKSVPWAGYIVLAATIIQLVLLAIQECLACEKETAVRRANNRPHIIMQDSARGNLRNPGNARREAADSIQIIKTP